MSFIKVTQQVDGITQTYYSIVVYVPNAKRIGCVASTKKIIKKVNGITPVNHTAMVAVAWGWGNRTKYLYRFQGVNAAMTKQP